MSQNRLKSKVVWAGLVSLLMIIMGNYGLYDRIGMKSDVFQAVTNSVLTLLVGFGVLNNGTDPDHF